MTEATAPAHGYHENYLMPGMRVWFRAQQVEKGRVVDVVYGQAGDLTYQGYTTIANATYLIFDRVEGSGKKARTEQFALNAAHCPHIGPFTG